MTINQEFEIKLLRNKLIVYSYLYYWQGISLISDAQWQQLADELVKLQAVYGTKIEHYDEEFEDWDATTGMHLPYGPDIAAWAAKIVGSGKR